MSDDDILDRLEPGDPRPPVIDRARADLAAGRPWIAANQLHSHLADDPLDAQSRELLVDVLLGMDDHVAAGRVAIATEREDPAALEPSRSPNARGRSSARTTDARTTTPTPRSGIARSSPDA